MTCANSYALELFVMGAVLIVFALAGLIYTAVSARKSAAGGALLEACGGDWETVALAIDNVRNETATLIDAARLGIGIRRIDPRDFHK